MCGLDVVVFQFVKNAKWKVFEEMVFRHFGQLHDQHGIGGTVEWHNMDADWLWTRTSCKAVSDRDHAEATTDDWATQWLLWAGCVHPPVPAELGLG